MNRLPRTGGDRPAMASGQPASDFSQRLSVKLQAGERRVTALSPQIDRSRSTLLPSHTAPQQSMPQITRQTAHPIERKRNFNT